MESLSQNKILLYLKDSFKFATKTIISIGIQKSVYLKDRYWAHRDFKIFLDDLPISIKEANIIHICLWENNESCDRFKDYETKQS